MKHTILTLILIAGCGKAPTQEREQAAAPGASTPVFEASEKQPIQAAENFAGQKVAAPQVTTPSGTVRGALSGNIRTFQGIPYAKPPVGDRRFKKPEAFPAWSGVRDAFAPGAQCPQLEDGDIGSEDCLFLNVYAPTTRAPAAKKPVMVFFHGGGFDNGSGYHAKTDDALYNGVKLSALGDVIIVTMNYRLGALGFLAHPALSEVEGPSGVNGILDQILALEWVQSHVASFGGDPTNVTIFGESAGAMSVCTHVAQSYKRGLFKRAIMESGSCQIKSEADANAYGESLVAKLGCDAGNAQEIVACLRDVKKLPASVFVESQINLDLKKHTIGGESALAFAPVVNGVLFSKTPLEIIKSGSGQKVDMIIGFNRYEVPGLLFQELRTAADLEKFLVNSGFTGAERTKLLQLYPLIEHLSHKNRAAAIATDIQFTCPKIELTKALAQNGSKVYNYRFDLLGAFHGTELPYVFQTLPEGTDQMRTMGMLWTSYASKGKPTSDFFAWQTANSKQVDLVFDGGFLTYINDYRVKQCEVILGSVARMQ